MSYCAQNEIETAIPAQHLNDALDDDRDGTADSGVLATIIASASNAVDAYLAGRFTVPFADPVPAPCREAAFVFACERIYDRRQILDKNPFKERADAWRKRLDAIGRGAPLDAATSANFTPGAAIVANVDVDTSMR